MDMRDKIADIVRGGIKGHASFDEVADAIVAALPDMIAPLVWTLHSPDDQPFWSAKGYSIESVPRDTWYFMGCYYADVEDAKVAANTHYRSV